GGERVRYQLLKMVYSEVNFLIMDEPTNHLDLASIEILEEALQEYSGTLLVVSHDRFFLNKIVDGIYALEDKALFYYDGNIDYYRKKRKEQEEQQKKREAAAERKLQSKIKNPRNDKREQVTKEKELQKIIKEIEDEVSLIEARIQENNQQMAKPENLADYEYLHKLKEENRSLHVHLEDLLSRWEGEISKIEVDE
ncbi:MAG: ABC transporter ATP-binding protein, partial [Halanaerobium sp.]|nr:ABC transporter ATP-binding protein [Halanaerobium sp.]